MIAGNGAPAVDGSVTMTPLPTSLFRVANARFPEKVLEFGGRYFALESSNHRVLVLNRAKTPVGQIGRIGDGVGEFYYPSDIAIDRQGNLYVLEARKKRVQVFDQDAKVRSSFYVETQPYGIVVNSKQEILLGMPLGGALVSVYARDGHRLRSFGNLRTMSDFYGAPLRTLDKGYRVAINRVSLAVANDDSVFTAFVGSPFTDKFDPDGHRVWEREFPAIGARVVGAYTKTQKSPHLMTWPTDGGVSIPFVGTGIAVDNCGRLFWSVQWDGAWIGEYDLAGNFVHAFEPSDRAIFFRNITLSEDGGFLLAPGFINADAVHNTYLLRLPNPPCNEKTF